MPNKALDIALSTIQPSKDNPRGTVVRDESFARLIDSIYEVGILVPLIVRKLDPPNGKFLYELIDGERRYLAARELGVSTVPANVIEGETTKTNPRKLMFHLHMTREQWGPLAQCRSLTEAYPELVEGVPFDEKEVWSKRLAIETGMSPQTARDRVHVLAWSGPLKRRFFDFFESQPKKARDLYSYLLAIEASVVEPSRKAFPMYYNHGRPPEQQANFVREALFKKVATGLVTGLVSSREQIRNVTPLFSPQLEETDRTAALSIFEDLVAKEDVFFEDARLEMQARLPELVSGSAPKPKRLIGAIRALAKSLEEYGPDYINNATHLPEDQRRLKLDLIYDLNILIEAALQLRSRLDD